jgi:hypothetical protein
MPTFLLHLLNNSIKIGVVMDSNTKGINVFPQLRGKINSNIAHKTPAKNTFQNFSSPFQALVKKLFFKIDILNFD